MLSTPPPLARRNRIEWAWFVLLFVLLAGYFAYSLQQDRAFRIERESARLLAQSNVVNDILVENLQAANRMLDHVVANFQQSGRSAAELRQAEAQLTLLERMLPAVGSLHIADAQGKVLVTSVSTLHGINIAERDFFKAVAAHPDVQTLHVGAPFRTADRQWVINLTRAIVDKHGGFAGVAWVSLEERHLALLIDSVRYSDDMWSSIIHGSGRLFVIRPPMDLADVSHKDDPTSMFNQHVASGKNALVQSGISHFLGQEVLLAGRTVEPASLHMDQPLYIAVARQMEGLLVQWRQRLRHDVILLMSLLVVSALGLWNLQRRRSEEEWHLRQDGERVRQSEAQLRSYIDHAPVGIFIVDASGRYVDVNPAGQKMVGYSMAELSRMGVADLVETGAQEQTLQQYKQIMHCGGQVDFELNLCRKGGAIFPASLRTVVLSTDRVMGFCSDISAQKEAERQLLHHREQLQAEVAVRTTELTHANLELEETLFAMDRVGIALHFIDFVSGRLLRANRHAAEMLGYTQDEMLDLMVWDIDSNVTPESYPLICEGIRQQQFLRFESLQRCKDGHILPVEMTVYYHPGETGAAPHFIAFGMDIRERKL